MATTKEMRNERLSKQMMENLQKRHFEAYYCPTAKEAVEKAVSLIPAKSSVSWGGSMTIRDMGLTKAIHDGDYEVLDRDLVEDMAQRTEIQRQALLVDYFLTSSNAITEDGILVNIDGAGNRVAALCYGPKNVIVVCSMQKVTKDVETAVSRVRNYVAPINSMRFLGKTPCSATGSCHDCKSLECICNQVVVTRVCRPQGRIKVILVGEELGY